MINFLTVVTGGVTRSQLIHIAYKLKLFISFINCTDTFTNLPTHLIHARIDNYLSIYFSAIENYSNNETRYVQSQ